MDPNPVQLGQGLTEFPGGSFNALVADYYARKAQQAQSNALRGNSSRLVVSCNNSESTTIEPGEILGFSAPIFTLDAAPDGDPQQVYAAPMIKGVTPAVPDHSSQFVVALDYIRGTGDVTGGAVGPCCLMGLAWVKVNWTDAGHDHVIVAEGETQLQSSGSGIKPIWKDTIPGELPADVWALIQIGGGSGSSSPDADIYIVTKKVNAATWDGETLTPNDEGQATRGTINGATGALTIDDIGTVVDLLNYDPGEEYEVGTGIKVNSSPVSGKKEVDRGWCSVLSPWPPEE